MKKLNFICPFTENDRYVRGSFVPNFLEPFPAVHKILRVYEILYLIFDRLEYCYFTRLVQLFKGLYNKQKLPRENSKNPYTYLLKF